MARSIHAAYCTTVFLLDLIPLYKYVFPANVKALHQMIMTLGFQMVNTIDLTASDVPPVSVMGSVTLKILSLHRRACTAISSAAFAILLLTHGENEKGEKRRRSHKVGSRCLRWMAGIEVGKGHSKQREIALKSRVRGTRETESSLTARALISADALGTRSSLLQHAFSYFSFLTASTTVPINNIPSTIHP